MNAVKSGTIEVPNIRISPTTEIKPFRVTWEDYDEVVQVDVEGFGVLNYEGTLNQDMLLDIRTNIAKALTKYGKITKHKASDIIYTLNFKKAKRFNHEHGAYYAYLSMSIFYKKPVKKAAAYQLQPTTELITSIILGEIFIVGSNAKKI